MDKAILRKLQIDGRTPLGKIAKELKIPKSRVHHRTKRMKEAGVIEGYYAKLNPVMLGEDYITVTFIRAKYSPSYHDKIGKMLLQILESLSYILFLENMIRRLE
jgi:DNA-binding Lrp family transcriptional regulator